MQNEQLHKDKKIYRNGQVVIQQNNSKTDNYAVIVKKKPYQRLSDR